MDEQNFPNIFEEPGGLKGRELLPEKRLERSKTNKIITGLCAGIADHFKIDPSLVRLLMLLSVLFGLWSVAAYFIASFLIPPEKVAADLNEEEKALLSKINFRTIFGGLLMLAGIYSGLIYWGFYSTDNIFALPYNFMFPFLAIVIGAFFLGNKEELYLKSNKIFPVKFYRSHKDKIFLGVCGGLANYLHIQTVIIRTIFLLSAILTLGLFGIAYFLISTSIPLEEIEPQP